MILLGKEQRLLSNTAWTSQSIKFPNPIRYQRKDKPPIYLQTAHSKLSLFEVMANMDQELKKHDGEKWDDDTWYSIAVL